MKEIKTKPMLYASMLPIIQEIGIRHGYNILVHGSMNRDLDLVCIPWVDNPKSHYELLTELENTLTGTSPMLVDLDWYFMFSVLPGRRYSYVINLKRGDESNNYQDPQFYLDISFTNDFKFEK